MLSKILQVTPEYRDYVWGGDRLRPGFAPTAEAWVIYANDKIAAGPDTGRTLDALAAEYGPQLLGGPVFERRGGRFPLLIKLIDSLQWLSLQVHPNDAQALQLEGPGFSGKTEAYHILDAPAGARLIAGLQRGVTRAALETALRGGTILDLARYVEVQAGDTLYMPAGVIHSLGPGLLLYEVQQTSDLTYRVYDWGRPQTGRRVLHIDKSLAVADLSTAPQPFPLPQLHDGDVATLGRSPYFNLEMLAAEFLPIDQDTGGESFHALTVIEGRACLSAGGEVVELVQYQSALIPAATRQYHIEPVSPYRLLRAIPV
jgi:mannose-6-phosphate isomerase